MSLRRIIAIVGPTASGKTSLSLVLAKRFSGEIISADSRQVYRSLDIGTEKITPAEMRCIPHHLIDVADVGQAFSALDFKQQGTLAIDGITHRGHIPFVVGGTGFYIRALLDGLTIPEVPPNESLRLKLAGRSAPELYARLLEKDPDRAATVEIHNPRRLMRALEIVEALGKVPPLQVVETPYEVLYIGIETPDEILRERITARLDIQIQRGLFEEVARLCTQVNRERLNEFGYEYRLSADYLEGLISLEELREQLVNELWQYAKRQRTWFKRDKRIHWFRREQETDIEKLVEEFLMQSEKAPPGAQN